VTGRRHLLAPLGASCLLLLHGLLLYGSAGRDDAHITFAAAASLARGAGLVNYNGAPLEQSASLLHVLALGGLAAVLPVPIPTLGGGLAVAAGIATLWIAWWMARAARLRLAGAVPWLVAATPYLAYWSFGGLETSLHAASALAYAAWAAAWFGAAGPAGWLTLAVPAFIWVRPEAGAVGLLAVTGLGALGRPVPRRGALAAAVAIVAGVAAVTAAARWAGLGQPFPQPVYAKTEPVSLERLAVGAQYVAREGGVPSLVAAAALAMLAARGAWMRRDAPVLQALAALAAAQLTFVVAVGGDWMEGGRFLVPVLPAVIVLAAAGAAELPRRWPGAALALLAALLAVDAVGFARHRSLGISALEARAAYAPVLARLDGSSGRFSWFELANRAHLRDVPAALALERLVTALDRERSAPVLVLSKQMGMVVHHAWLNHRGRVEVLDMRSLATDAFTRCPVTRDLPRGAAGHMMTYRMFFERLPELRATCGIRPPDVIAELGPYGEAPLVERWGYRIVYRQTGAVRATLGQDLGAAQYLAVRVDLLPLAAQAGLVDFDFGGTGPAEKRDPS
jgi:hypothetical protein